MTPYKAWELFIFEISKNLYDQGLELMKIGRNK